MKKLIVFGVFASCIAATSFAQDAPPPAGKKVVKKENKMDKKSDKAKPDKAEKKQGKADKKDAKGK